MESSRFWRLLDQNEAVGGGENALDRLEEGVGFLQKAIAELQRRRRGETPSLMITGLNSGALTEHSEEYLECMPVRDLAAFANVVASNVPKVTTSLLGIEASGVAPKTFEAMIGARATRPRASKRSRSDGDEPEPKRWTPTSDFFDGFPTTATDDNDTRMSFDTQVTEDDVIELLE